MSEEEFEDLDGHLNSVAMDIQMATTAMLYKGLRSKGLSRLDAAAIVASMINMNSLTEEGDENSQDQR